MASISEATLRSISEPYNPFHRPTSARATAGGMASALGAPAWPGVFNIWRAASPKQSESRDGVNQTGSASPTSNDSFTLTPTHRDLTRSGSQESPLRNPLRIATTSTAPSLGVVGRSPTKLPSPTYAELFETPVNPDDVTMPPLGTATLLNGSAPDIEPNYRTVYTMSSNNNNNRLNNINVGHIHDFVPTTQHNFNHPRLAPSRLNSEIPTTFAPFEPGFHVNGRGYPLGNPGFATTVGHPHQSRAWEHAINSLSHPHRLDEVPHNAGRPGHGAETSGSTINGDHSFMPDFNSLRLQDLPDQEFSSAPLTSQSTQRPQQRHPWSPTTDGGSGSRIRGTVGHPTQSHTTPILTQQHPVPGTTGAMSNRSLPPNTAGMAYTPSPSYTPPTAPGSQRSNSGSGASTRASSQSIDTRFAPLDGATPYIHGRSIMAQHGAPATNFDFLGQWTTPYANLYSTSQIPNDVRPDTQAHRHTSSEARIQHEKEQNLSPLMKDFRANHKTKRFELKDAYNHIVEFSGDQHGSRFIQGKLETANSDEKEKVFCEIQENCLQLMTDIFGNYVIQKLFEYGTQAQKKALANQMRGRVHYLTTQVYGCRVIQKALEHVLTDQQASMVKELEGNILNIVENQNGNHVIQKAIERVPSEHIQFIFDAHQGHVIRLSKHNYGCRVIQRMLEHGPPDVKRSILDELRDATPILIEDQYGNYVMQHIIRNGEAADRRMVVDIIQRQLLHFSKHKFASNVVEAAIECAEERQQQEILQVLTSELDFNGQSQVYGLIRDQYGNYVIQKVLTKLQGAALNKLVLEIQHHLVTLRKISHGKQVTAMEKALAGAILSLGRQYTGRGSSGPFNGQGPATTSTAPTAFPGHIPMAPAQQPRFSQPSVFSRR